MWRQQRLLLGSLSLGGAFLFSLSVSSKFLGVLLLSEGIGYRRLGRLGTATHKVVFQWECLRDPWEG